MEPGVEFAEVVEERSGRAAVVYIFAPTAPLAPGTTYEATAIWGQLDLDSGQERIATITWSFTTAAIGSADGVILPPADSGHPHPEPPDPFWLIENAAPDSTPCSNPFIPCSTEFESINSLEDFQDFGRLRAALINDGIQADPRDSQAPRLGRWGTSLGQLDDSSTPIVAYAIHLLPTDISPGESTSIFASALLPPNNSLLEVVTTYPAANLGIPPVLAVYQHGPDPTFSTYAKLLSDAFISTYTSGGYYATTITRTGDQVWRVYLWNYSSSVWVEIAVGNGAGSHDEGWDQFEVLATGRCDGDLPEFESRAIQIYDGTWHTAQSLGGSEISDLGACGRDNYDQDVDFNVSRWLIDPLF